MIEVDYDFYSKVYLGDKLDEEAFKKQVYKAYKQVNNATYNRVKVLSKDVNIDEDLLFDIKMCICECAEYCNSFSNTGGKVLSSVKAGAVTESYSTASLAKSESSACSRVIEDYLGVYGLLAPVWG